MNILVTGGAGFIGSNFVNYMLAEYPEHRIICFDKLTYAGNLSNLAAAFSNPRFCFVKGDICDTVAVEEVFKRYSPQIVVNFAAESHVDNSIKSPEVCIKTNICGTQTLLDACVRHGVRFHQISTDEVYGDAADVKFAPFCEDAPLRPSSPYSASKAAADLLVGAYCRTYGLFATITRCSNNYGPYQFPEKFIPRAITCALADSPVPVYGSGQNVRDWLAVEDNCRAICLVLWRGERGGIYNVGGGCSLANTELAKKILTLLGKPLSLVSFVQDRPGHDVRYSINSSKLRALGWQPRVPFEEGIARTVAWYKDNAAWLGLISSGKYRKLSPEDFTRG